MFSAKSELFAQSTVALNPPQSISASDFPWDHGDKINLKWNLSEKNRRVSFFIIEQINLNKDDGFVQVGKVDSNVNEFTVQDLDKNSSYYFRIKSGDRFENLSKPKTLDYAIAPEQDWFDGSRFPLFLITIIFSGSVIFWIFRARSGVPLKIRKIAGLEAVDEAVGRATEMGQPILFVPGIQDINEIQTIAGLTVLSRVSKVAAEYDAKVEVPTSKSLVMTAARETIQASFLSAGRPESYNQDLVYYVTDEQFGYVAYIQGMMVRKKPAACFYMGAFFAESLILAETGNTIGAIQVAGTAMPAQLPFFVAACDYTLIGEEFFAASAYLSEEPDQLGSLKGQDLGKVIVGVGIITGVTLLTLGTILGEETIIGSKLLFFAEYLKSTILT